MPECWLNIKTRCKKIAYSNIYYKLKIKIYFFIWVDFIINVATKFYDDFNFSGLRGLINLGNTWFMRYYKLKRIHFFLLGRFYKKYPNKILWFYFVRSARADKPGQHLLHELHSAGPHPHPSLAGLFSGGEAHLPLQLRYLPVPCVRNFPTFSGYFFRDFQVIINGIPVFFR